MRTISEIRAQSREGDSEHTELQRIMKALEEKKLITAKKREDVELKFRTKKEKKSKKNKSKKD